METLTGSVAIISGGLGDIGRAIALELARRGADVALGDLAASQDAAPLIETLSSLGRKARYDRVDVADASAVTAWVGAVESACGIADLIIPNAGRVTIGGIRSISATDWNQELRVNLDGAFHLAQAGSLRLLEHRRPGRVVFVGSWAAHAPHPHIPAYCASKAGLRMLCRCMAAELAAEGILVNEVAPGYVDAGLTGKLFKLNPASRDASIRRVPVGKLISPHEVAMQVAYLCEPENRQITGSTLLLDGGLSLINPSSLPAEP